MPARAKQELLQILEMTNVPAVYSLYQTLYGMGYRGSMNTVGNNATLSMVLQDRPSVNVAVGDFVLYRTTPALEVVAVKTPTEFHAQFDIVTA